MPPRARFGLGLALALGSSIATASAGCGSDAPPTVSLVSGGGGGPADAAPREDAAKPVDAGRDPTPCKVAWNEAFKATTHLVDRCGIYVAPWGDDDGPGTMKVPKRSIAAAIRASGAAPDDGDFDPYRVLVCNGTYQDSVLVEHRLTVQAGLTCEGGTWQYTPGTHATLFGSRAAIPGTPVLTARNTAKVGDVSIRDMELVARDADEPGASSIALFADHSFGVELYQVRLVAGRGADGANGAAVTGALPVAVNGIDPVGALPGNAVACFCPDGVTIGGAGGAPGLVRQPGAPAGSGEDGTGVLASTAGHGGLGGLAECTDMNGAGFGGDGAAIVEQAPLAGTDLGTISTSGFRAARGHDGLRGARGQGGGGGAARNGGGGASGGCGGCGGKGGQGGQGGGASIALLDDHSDYVVLSHCTVTTADGGHGGRGGAGQSGLPGAPGGSDPAAVGCAGGRGGDGARGQAGSGGAGGLSVAILLAPALESSPNELTKKPLLEDTSSAALVVGKAGRGGGDEAPASGRGPDGVAASIFTLPR